MDRDWKNTKDIRSRARNNNKDKAANNERANDMNQRALTTTHSRNSFIPCASTITC
jgi:hypothetical protein